MLSLFTTKNKKERTLKEVTNLLSQLKIPTGLVFTPVNLESEKEKFFNSDRYNPIFEYKVVKNNNSEILSQLSDLRNIVDIDPRLSEFYIDLIDSKRESSELMHAVGNNERVTEISISKYGKPSPELFRNSARVLRGKVDSYRLTDSKRVKKDTDLLDYKEIEHIFREVFDELGLGEWKVAKSKNIGKNMAKIGAKRKEVLVDPNIVRSKLKLKKTIIHEVGTHVLRTVNGYASGFEALGKSNLPSYLDVEEGLATWNEENMGLLTLPWLKKKAALTWAIYVGENMSFRELYNCMLGVLPKKASFDVVYRVKRGLGDTSYPGIYAKDIVYFRGFRRVKKKLEANPSLYEKLYAGKISFKQCVWVDEGLIPKAKLVPTKEMWRDIFKKVGI
jgi:hypothetical protein